jgi:hypothetical protein
MIDKNEQDIRPKTPDPRLKGQEEKPKQGRILRAKDIIPGTYLPGSTDEQAGAEKFGVPQFNLNRDLVSGQRRQSADRRKVPEATEDRGQKTEDGGQLTEDRRQNIEPRTQETEYPAPLRSFASSIETLRDSIIVEIVARDIERMCAGR